MSIPAILAPVPLHHLVDGKVICQREGKVAYGSQAWAVFAKLTEEIKKLPDGFPIDVFIYASHTGDPTDLTVTWRARFIRYVNSRAGRHPDGTTFRPESTWSEDKPGRDCWAGFWEVTELRRLPDDEVIPITQFTGYSTGRQYKPSFVPEGPLLVDPPVIPR